MDIRGPKVFGFDKRFSAALFLLICLSLLFQIRWSPPNHKIQIDGTVYAYGGTEILKGNIPYRDFWDNKPPGVYYLDAAAFLVFGANAWGIWYLTVLWTALISIGFFLFLRVHLRPTPAILLCAVMLATLLERPFYQGSNLTEFYGVLPAVCGLYLAAAYFHKPRTGLVVILGVLFAAGALLKPTDIGTTAACMLLICVREGLRRNYQRLAQLVLGFFIPVLVVAALIFAYWGIQGALGDLWQATVAYNLMVASHKFGLRSLYVTVRRLTTDSALSIPFVFAVGTALMIWRAKPGLLRGDLSNDHGTSEPIPAALWTFLTCCVALGLEVLLVASAAKNFGHYYEIAIPSLYGAAAFWLWFDVSNESDNTPHRFGVRGLPILAAGAFAVWFVANFGLIRPSVDHLRSFALDAPVRRPLRTDVGKFISANTSPDETVLVWSTGAELNFETGRSSPSPYVYYKPLFQTGFQNSQRWASFMQDLETDPPSLIIAHAKGGYAPNFDVPENQLAAECHCQGEILDGFKVFSAYVKENYSSELMFDGAFRIYRPLGH